MTSVIEQATDALAAKRFATVKTLSCDALATHQPLAIQVQLLELLAQAQTGLDDHTEAARTWQQAYEQAPTPLDTWRLFTCTRQAYQHLRDYPALVQLAHAQLAHATTTQERASCLLIAGEAMYHLHQYRDAQNLYFTPALALASVAPETRVYLCYYLGLSTLSAHDFTAATDAFRLCAELALGLQLGHRSAAHVAQQAQWDQLRNAALFYQGVMHLIYHRPRQAIQVLQRIQRPATSMDGLKKALYLALAYRDLHLPDAADQALHALTRSQRLPELLHTPAAVVRAGIANLRGATDAIGSSLEIAREAPLGPHASWEPSWRVCLYQELGLALQQTGARHAAIACYEESLKAALYRMGHWRDGSLRNWLRSANLYIALDNLPLHTWSAVIRSEMVRSLQALAWLYTLAGDGPLTDTVLALALRLAITPEQQSTLWLQRGWYTAIRCATAQPGVVRSPSTLAMILAGVQQARAHAAETPLASALWGVEALLQEDERRSFACFATIPDVPETPYTHAMCVAAWLWTHGKQGGLDDALRQALSGTPGSWQTAMTLSRAIEMLLVWTTAAARASTTAVVGWLGPLLHEVRPQSLVALRRLARPGYLPDTPRGALTEALTVLLTDATAEPCADEVAELLGGSVLLGRIDTLLARFDHVAPSLPSRQSTRRRKHRRRLPVSPDLPPDTSRLRQLVQRLQAAPETTPDRSLPEVIYRWFQRYPRLGTHAPDVVSALLDLLRHCPQAHPTIQDILHQVSLSKRQRRTLEAALEDATPAAGPAVSPLAWESIRSWSLVQVLEVLSDAPPPALTPPDSAVAARTWYVLAVTLARMGILSHAADCAHTCLRLTPEQPLAHFLLAQIHRLLQHHTTALHHSMQAWHALQSVPPQVIHLEVMNQILVLLGALHHYEDFPEWIVVFRRLQAGLQTATLSPAHQQRLREEMGEYALAQVLYLSTTSTGGQETDTVETQLALLAQAIDTGAPATRLFALHRQAETLTRFQRCDEAAATYLQLLHQWPDDRRARLRLALLTATTHATEDITAADQALTEALTLAVRGMHETATLSPLTPAMALSWLQHTASHDPCVDEVSEVLTTCGGIAVQRREVAYALDLLEPLYALQGQPLQAYYLAEAYYLRSQVAMADVDRLQDCERALQHAQHALDSVPHRKDVATLVQQVQVEYARLTAATQQARALTAYRTRICALFTHYNVPFQEEMGAEAPDAPWLTMDEHIDLDEASGNAVVTIQLCFNDNATNASLEPSEQEVRRYALHQSEVQRLEETYGMAALPWPPIAYTGHTAFALLFPARLGLNRDLLFVAYATPQALVRYAHVLYQTVKQLSTLATAHPTPSVSTLAARARWATVLPLLQQRLSTLATSAPSKALQRQLKALQAELPPPSWETPWLDFPAFLDAWHYFAAIATALSPVLTAPPTHTAHRREVPDKPERPPRRKPSQRQTPTVRRMTQEGSQS
ncbi:MAG: hypothetical protein V3U27_17880 [Candidatus Tectomicrobia bacterium]